MAEPEMEEEQAPQQAAAQQARTPRMPTIEEFPPIAQKQIAAQQTRIEHIAEHAAARKKPGLFDRLASVGLGRKHDPVVQPREPSMGVQQAPRAQQPQQRQQAPAQAHIDPGLDDDQLEIPAFLRRQAN
jgi:cell division protein FtsZ